MTCDDGLWILGFLVFAVIGMLVSMLADWIKYGRLA